MIFLDELCISVIVFYLLQLPNKSTSVEVAIHLFVGMHFETVVI